MLGFKVYAYLKSRRMARLSIGVLVFFVGLALFADFIASDLPVLLKFKGELYILPNIFQPVALRDMDNQRLRKELVHQRGDWALMPFCEFGPLQHPEILRPPPAPPDGVHWLGTDDRGRDVLARLVHGSRISLLIGGFSVAIYVVIGVMLGMLGGFYKGRVDKVVSRVIEIGLTFPTFFLILIIMALLERPTILTIILVFGLTRFADVARLVRAEVLRLRELDFIMAARVNGAGPWRIMLLHLLPNALGVVVVNATFGVAGAIVGEAALTFLGFGTPPPTASWGELLSQAFEYQNKWWLILCPGLMLFLMVTALNLFGEALQEALDPREKT